MRKGLVTLGVVALVLAVSPGYTEAPVVTCVPDVVISDVEQNTQTADNNMFIFSDALNLDAMVNDPDTSDSLLAWSGIDPSGTIEINGIMLNDPLVDTLTPGAQDLRAVSAMASFRNAALDGVGNGGVSTETMVTLYVSDGTTVSEGTMKVMTVDTTTSSGSPDAVMPAALANYGFDAGAEGWTQFFVGPPSFIDATLAAAGGALTLTEAAGHTLLVFGSWESPRDPAVALMPRLGCVMRARYQVSSDATDQSCPGFRLRGLTAHVSDAGGTWEQDFTSLDYTTLDQVIFGTPNFIWTVPPPLGEPGLISRIPAAGQEYNLMVFPRQVSDMLTANDPAAPIVHYVTFDLLDLEGATADNDSGTLTIDSVVIEGIARPDLGAGAPFAAMTASDFSSGWSTGVNSLGTMNDAGLVVATGADLSITVAPGNEFFEAFAEMTTGVPLESGRTYRVAFSCTSSELPGGDKGPKIRTNVTSSKFVWSAQKELEGGALLARLTATPSLMELWFVAPSDIGAGVTEEMKAQFVSWYTANVAQWPDFRAVSGTVTCTEIQADIFDY